MKKKGLSIFKSTEETLKKHVESNKSKTVDITRKDDQVGKQLDKINEVNNESSEELEFDFLIPSPEDLDSMLLDVPDYDEDEDEVKSKKPDTFDVSEQDRFLNELNFNKLDKDPLKEKLDTYLGELRKSETEVNTIFYSKNKVKSDKEEVLAKKVREDADELEQFKVEVQKLMKQHGYSFSQAKEIYDRRSKVEGKNAGKVTQIIRVQR